MPHSDYATSSAPSGRAVFNGFNRWLRPAGLRTGYYPLPLRGGKGGCIRAFGSRALRDFSAGEAPAGTGGAPVLPRN
jgi:hypothetical protein